MKSQFDQFWGMAIEFQKMARDMTSTSYWKTAALLCKEMGKEFLELGKWLLRSRRLIRFMLVVVFVVNTGLISDFVALRQKYTKKPDGKQGDLMKYSPYIMAANSHRLEKFIQPIFEEAEHKLAKGTYSLELYMTDLNRIFRFEEEKLGYFAGDLSSQRLDKLWLQVRNNNWNDIKNAQVKHLGKNYRIHLIEYLKNLEAPLWPKVCAVLLSILFWLQMFYLKNLPVAAALFCLWLYEARQNQQRFFLGLSPGSVLGFLSLLIVYPVVVVYFWSKAMSECNDRFMMQAEIRRHKRKLFGWLTPYEKKLIARFVGQERSRKKLRTQLEREGLTVRRSLPTAILATILLLTAQWIVIWQHQVFVCTLTIELSLQAQVDEDEQIHGPTNQGSPDNLPLPACPLLFPALLRHWFHQFKRSWQKWLIPIHIEHIPIRQLDY